MVNAIKYKTIRIKKTNVNLRKEIFNYCKENIINTWGTFPNSYIIHKINTSDAIVLALNGSEIVGFGQYKFYNSNINHVTYCAIGLIIIKQEWQNRSIGNVLLLHLFFRAFIDNLIIYKKYILDIIYVTDNILYISIIKKISNFVYPDISKFDIKKNKQPNADDATWSISKHYLSRVGERIFRLQREGNIISGSYDDVPNLLIKTRQVSIHGHQEKMFYNKYMLNRKKQNEVVVRAKCNLLLLIRLLLKKFIIT